MGGVNPEPEPEPDTHEYVDLGLPSGTLWATDNIKDEGGNVLFFAWGETSGYTFGQRTFDWNNYQWGNPDNGTLVTDELVDTNGKLKPEYDAATVNWGPNWRMPTKEEFEELLEYTDVYYGNIGSTDFSHGGTGFVINMPGYIEGDRFIHFYGETEVGHVWASTVDDSYRSYANNFYAAFNFENGVVSRNSRCTGIPVYPVRK